MPKLKKQPRNAYYFFMVDRKQELEARGFRFPGGMSDVASTVRQEWITLKPEDKAYFEDLAKKAKEEEKLNFNNKFTATGESYAHVMERNAYEEELQFTMERLVDDLTVASETVPPENRNFIIIKAIHSCEVLLPRHAFWPLEITIAAFNLADGMKSHYWTLVDTETTPVGYASAAKETSEETGLPQPGSRIFEEKHRNYAKILMNIKGFVETFLKDYGPKYILFAMGPDIKSADGCLQWLSENAELSEEERFAMDGFMNKLAFYKLPRLVLRFANIAKRRNECYNNVMALFNNLERSAESLLTEGCFNYRDDITCDYHNLEKPSIKMDVCAKNVVLRMIYLIIKEIVPAMLIELKDGHDIDLFKKFTKKAAPVPPQAAIPGPPPGSRPRASVASFLAAGAQAQAQARSPPPMPRPREPEESHFLSEAWGNPMPQYAVPANPYETDGSTPTAPASVSAKRRSTNEDYPSGDYPPNPNPTKQFRATFDIGGRGGTAPNYASVGRHSDPRGPVFTDSDFPSLGNSGLGSLWGNSNERGGGHSGRGRGRGSGMAPGPSSDQLMGGPSGSTGGRGCGRR